MDPPVGPEMLFRASGALGIWPQPLTAEQMAVYWSELGADLIGSMYQLGIPTDATYQVTIVTVADWSEPHGWRCLRWEFVEPTPRPSWSGAGKATGGSNGQG